MLTIAFVIACIVAGTLFLLWQDEHEKLIKAENQIKDLKRKLKKSQQSGKSIKDKSGFAIKPFLDQTKLLELQRQTKDSQDMLADIFTKQDTI